MQNDLDRETTSLQELEAQKQDAQDRLEEMDQQKHKLEDMLNEVRIKCQEESQMVREREKDADNVEVSPLWSTTSVILQQSQNQNTWKLMYSISNMLFSVFVCWSQNYLEITSMMQNRRKEEIKQINVK